MRRLAIAGILAVVEVVLLGFVVPSPVPLDSWAEMAEHARYIRDPTPENRERWRREGRVVDREARIIAGVAICLAVINGGIIIRVWKKTD